MIRLRDTLCGISGEHSRGIFKIETYTGVPRTPADLIGITNLRGTVAPVLDLGPVLALAPWPMEKPVVNGLIVEVDGNIVVLAVDEIAAFEPVEIDRLPSVGDAVPAGLVRFALGEFEYRDEPVVLLDIKRLLAAIKIGTSKKGSRETGAGKIETNGKAVQGSVPEAGLSGSRK